MTYVVTEPCIDVLDRSCLEECPVDCIYEGARMMYIHPDECIDCGACESACPMDAIYFEEDIPETMAPYLDTGRSFIADLGAPGGAATLGKQPYDTGPAAATTAP